MSDILNELSVTLEKRKQVSSNTSYVATLYEQGINKILEKVGEECTETILAAKDLDTTDNPTNRENLVSETADLWFHTMVMLSKLNINHEEVLQELAKRFGVSGLDEKAARSSESN